MSLDVPTLKGISFCGIMCAVHAVLYILTYRTAISYSYKYSLASPILSFQLVSKCLAQGSNFYYFLLCLVSDCIRECQNNGTLNNSTCSCTCAAGYSGPDCGSECTVVGFSTYAVYVLCMVGAQ